MLELGSAERICEERGVRFTPLRRRVLEGGADLLQAGRRGLALGFVAREGVGDAEPDQALEVRGLLLEREQAQPHGLLGR